MTTTKARGLTKCVRAAVADCERIYHLAGVVSHRHGDLGRLREVNVVGTRHLVSAAQPGARVVHVSSVATIGPVLPPAQPADERHPLPRAAARLIYASSKLEGSGSHSRRLPVVSQFDDARDVARGLMALADRGRAGKRTILASEQGNLSWQDFFALLAQVAGVRRRVVRLPRPVARGAAHLAPLDSAPGLYFVGMLFLHSFASMLIALHRFPPRLFVDSGSL
jgi:nucleoside-diphosphate-sugar epimerase